jgi:Uma2 family endonuclease
MNDLAITTEPKDPRLAPDNIVRLHDVDWANWQRLLAMRGEHSAPRLAYLKGEVEIMSPSRSHASIKSVIGRLVETYCLEHEIPFRPLGGWTLESEPDERAVEPDECYIFGAEDASRPHLAIEVVWTSGGIDKLEIYRKLDVAEVWYWKRGVLTPYSLRTDGPDAPRYEPVTASLVLPGIDLAQLATFLDQPTAYDAIRAYRAALRGGTA